MHLWFPIYEYFFELKKTTLCGFFTLATCLSYRFHENVFAVVLQQRKEKNGQKYVLACISHILN